MEDISKSAQVLRLFAQAYGLPGIPRKRLVKLAYVADILTRQYLGHSLTELRWIKDHYGPNARNLPEVTNELEQCELAEEYERRDGSNRTIYLRASAKPLAFGFTLGENEVLRYIIDNYLSMEIEELIEEIAKQTDPFKAVTRHGDELPMHIVDGVKRNEIGFDLERVMRAEKQAADGEWATLADFANDLQADITARHAD
jgi:hypothetical protein